MYHSGTSLKIQQHVLSSLKDPQGSVRIVIATSALGMGVDFKGLHRANKEETLRLLEGLIKYQQPSKASTWNRQEAQAHAQR